MTGKLKENIKSERTPHLILSTNLSVAVLQTGLEYAIAGFNCSLQWVST